MAILETQWHRDPKVQSAGWEGMGLHAWGISYCDDNLTDGYIADRALPHLPRLQQALKMVLAVGLWHRVDGGYEVHKYLDHNRSKAKVDALRAANRERKAESRERSARNGQLHV